MKLTTLNVGFIKGESVYDEVVEEILNHQGIIFTKIKGKNIPDESRFPCIILTSYTDENYELASKLCLNEENIVIVDREVSLERILRALSGESEASENSTVPFINEYEKSLVETIARKFYELNLPLIQKWFWPSFSKACCVLTHDVDWLHYSPFHRVVFKRTFLHKFLKLVFNYLVFGINYGNNIHSIIREEEKRGLKSSFYLIPGYPKSQQDFMDALNLLRSKGFEIGLHGYYAHEDQEKLKRQKEALESYSKIGVKGIRQHGLKFSVPYTWKIEEKVGFFYDLTFHYNDKFGFRGGTCFPYHPINLDQEKRFTILEIPTCFIDYTVLYNQMSYAEALRTARELLKTVENFNGVFVACFHNTYLNEETFAEIKKLYKDLLDYAKKNGFWVPTAWECCSWWVRREKAEIKIVLKGNKAKIETYTHPLPVTISTQEEMVKVEIKQKTLEINLRDKRKHS